MPVFYSLLWVRYLCRRHLMKPDTRTAMADLITQVRAAIPFDSAVTELCADSCDGCSVKLLEFLGAELDNWQYRLDQGEIPSLGDLDKLARSSRKIYRVLQKNGVAGR